MVSFLGGKGTKNEAGHIFQDFGLAICDTIVWERAGMRHK